jgi:hypothetical protein
MSDPHGHDHDDDVFSDGYSTQLATVAGAAPGGMTARLNVGV